MVIAEGRHPADESGHQMALMDTQRQDDADTAREGEGGADWESGTEVYTLPCVSGQLVGSCCAAEAQLCALWWHRRGGRGWEGLEREQVYVGCWCSVAQSCLTPCDPMDYSPPGSPSMVFSRQEYYSGVPCPPPGDLPNPGAESRTPALQAGSLSLNHQGSPDICILTADSLCCAAETNTTL